MGEGGTSMTSQPIKVRKRLSRTGEKGAVRELKKPLIDEVGSGLWTDLKVSGALQTLTTSL